MKTGPTVAPALAQRADAVEGSREPELSRGRRRPTRWRACEMAVAVAHRTDSFSAGEAGVVHGPGERHARAHLVRDGALPRRRSRWRSRPLPLPGPADDDETGLVGQDDVALLDREPADAYRLAGGALLQPAPRRGRDRTPRRTPGSPAHGPPPRRGTRRRRRRREHRAGQPPRLRMPPQQDTSVRPWLSTTITLRSSAFSTAVVAMWTPAGPSARGSSSTVTAKPTTAAGPHTGRMPADSGRKPQLVERVADRG